MNKHIFFFTFLLLIPVMLFSQNRDTTLLNEILRQAEKSSKTSHYKQSTNFLKKALKLGSNSDSLISTIYSRIGSNYYRLDSTALSEYYYKKSLEIKECISGLNHHSLGQTYWDFGWLYKKTKEDSLAVESFTKCIDLWIPKYTRIDADIAKAHYQIAKLHYSNGKLNKAITSYMECADIRKKLSEIDKSIVADPFFKIGEINKEQGKNEEALINFKRGLKILEQDCEENIEDYLISYRNLIGVFFNMNKQDSAYQHIDIANEKAICYLDPASKKLATHFINLGFLFYELGKNKETLDYFKEGLKVYLKRDDVDMDLMQLYTNMGIISNADFSIQYNLKALEIGVKHFKKEAFELFYIYNNLGKGYFDKGNIKEAEKYFKKAKIACIGGGKEDLSTVYSNLGLIAKQYGKMEAALELYNTARLHLSEVYDSLNPKFTILHINIGDIHFSNEEYKFAINEFEKGLKIQQLSNQEKHFWTAVLYQNIAVSYSGLGNNKKAIINNEKSLDIHQALGEENNPRIALINNNIGAIYLEDKEYEKALFHFKEALRINLINKVPQSPENAVFYENIAKSFQSKMTYDSAYHYFLKGLKIVETGNDSNKIAKYYCTLGSFFQHKLEEIDSALFYVNKAISIYGEKEKTAMLAAIYLVKGSIFQDIDRLEESEYLLKKAVNIIKDKKGIDSENCIEYYNTLGLLYRDKKEYEKGIEHLLKALELRKMHSESVYYGYINLGLIYSDNGDCDKAIESYELSLEQSAGIQIDSSHLSSIYQGLGSAYLDCGDFVKAEYFYNFSKKINGRLKIRETKIATSEFYQGKIEFSKRNFAKALQYYKKSLNIQLKTGKSPAAAAVYYKNIGLAYQKLHKYDLALQFYNKAFEVNKDVFGLKHTMTFDYYTNLTGLYYDKEDKEKALKYQKKGEEVLLSLPNPGTQNLIQCYLNIADLNRYLENYNEALKYTKLAENIKTSISKYKIDALLIRGLIYRDKRDFTKAVNAFNKAKKLQIKIYGNVHPKVAQVYELLAESYLKNKQHKKALTYSDYALQALGFEPNEEIDIDMVTDFDYLSEVLNTKSLALYETYKITHEKSLLKQASETNNKVLKLSRKATEDISNLDNKSLFIEKNYEYAENAITIANEQNEINQVFDIIESNKAVELRNIISTQNIILPEEIENVKAKLESGIRFWRNKQQNQEADNVLNYDSTRKHINEQLFALQGEYNEFKIGLKKSNPNIFNLLYNAEIISVTDVQKQLSSNQTIIEFFVGDSTTYGLLINADTLYLKEISHGKESIQEQVSMMRSGIFDYWILPNQLDANYLKLSNKYATSACNLYESLLAPFKQLVKENITIIPDGALGYLPFEILLIDKPVNSINFRTHNYLLKHHKISYAFSSTTLFEMMSKQNQPQKNVLAFAPKFSDRIAMGRNITEIRKHLGALKYNTEEVNNIQSIMGGDVFEDNEATKTKFLELANTYQIIHLATHGKADDLAYNNAFLAFSEPIDTTLDSRFLYGNELYNFKLNADMVVLSACETGIGKLRRGEGILSLSRGFSYAGAKSIINTLWSVDDKKTSELMTNFYQNIKLGQRKDEALAKAKLNFIENQSHREAHPFFWSGFIPVGDMSPIEISHLPTWNYFLFGVLVLFFIGYFSFRK